MSQGSSRPRSPFASVCVCYVRETGLTDGLGSQLTTSREQQASDPALSPESAPGPGLNPITEMDKPDTHVDIYIHLLNLSLKGEKIERMRRTDKWIDMKGGTKTKENGGILICEDCHA